MGKIVKKMFVCIVFVCSFYTISFGANENSVDSIQKKLKEITSMDFKVISNKKFNANEVSLLIVESPGGERLVFLSSDDNSYIVPLNAGIPLSDKQSPLQVSIDGVNVYNKDLKDSKALKVFQKYTKYTLKIPAEKKTTQTIYMVLDTTCPYCLQEIKKLDNYLKDSNVEVLMVAFLGQRAQKRTAGYYAEIEKAKSRNDKIALLKKVFTKEYDPKSGDDKITKEITESTIDAGIEGVPYMFYRK